MNQDVQRMNVKKASAKDQNNNDFGFDSRNMAKHKGGKKMHN
jgi:hypothetical protein